MLVLETAVLGTFLALDLLLFFLFFEALLVPMYLLIGGWGGAAAHLRRDQVLPVHDGGLGVPPGRRSCSCTRRAAPGCSATATLDSASAGACCRSTTGRWLFLAFFVAFAVKVPLVPLHTWLPDAHTEAPTAGLGPPGRAAAEGRDVRADPVQPGALPGGVEVLRDVRRRHRGDRDHLRRRERADPDRHQAAGGVLVRLAPRLRRAGDVRVHPAGGHGGRAADGEPRSRDRRAVPARRDGLRADAHARPGRDGRARVAGCRG